MGRPRITKQTGHHIDTSQGKLGELARSDYCATYIKHKNYAAERPIVQAYSADMISKLRHPAMDLQTTNMRTYKPHGRRSRRALIRPSERELEDGEFNADTEYSKEYQKKSQSQVAVASAPVDDDRLPKETPKFIDKTTNREVFKGYAKLPATRRYGELPAFTHSLLFPDKENLKELLCSRTQLDFPHKTVRKPDLIKGAEPNIKVGEGDHDLLTTQRECFTYVPSFPKIRSKNTKAPHRPKPPPVLELVTNYSDDFQKRKGSRPRKPVAPAPDTLQIKMDNKYRVATEQQDQFHGWDVKKHKRPEAAKLHDNTRRSDEPMSVETTMQHDYIPMRQNNERLLAKPAAKYEPNPAKFNPATTNRRFFQDWGVTRRLRHGDFHEACNEPKKFTKVGVPELLPKSTTKEEFVEKVGRPRTSMKPDHSTIDTYQTHDFNTTAGMTYKTPPASAYIPEDFIVKC